MLIAAAQRADGFLNVERAQFQVAHDLQRLAVQPGLVHQPRRRETVHRRQRHIHLHRPLFDNALFFAVFWYQANARFDRRTHVVVLHRGTVDAHRATGAPVDTGNQLQQFGAPRADQPGNAQHFARTNAEVCRHHLIATRQILYPQHFAIGDKRLMVKLVDLPSDHFGDDALLILITDIDHPNLLSVTHNGGAVADPENLIHLVRDIDQRDAGRLQIANQLCQPVKFAWRQAGGRFIHGNYFGVIQQRPGNLNDLLLRYLEVPDRRIGIDSGIQRLQNQGSPRQLGLFIHPTASGAGQRATQKHVLRHGKLRHML